MKSTNKKTLGTCVINIPISPPYLVGCNIVVISSIGSSMGFVIRVHPSIRNRVGMKNWNIQWKIININKFVYLYLNLFYGHFEILRAWVSKLYFSRGGGIIWWIYKICFGRGKHSLPPCPLRRIWLRVSVCSLHLISFHTKWLFHIKLQIIVLKN